MSAPLSSEDLALADSQQVAFAALDRHVFNGIITPQQCVQSGAGVGCGATVMPAVVAVPAHFSVRRAYCSHDWRVAAACLPLSSYVSVRFMCDT